VTIIMYGVNLVPQLRQRVEAVVRQRYASQQLQAPDAAQGGKEGHAHAGDSTRLASKPHY